MAGDEVEWQNNNSRLNSIKSQMTSKIQAINLKPCTIETKYYTSVQDYTPAIIVWTLKRKHNIIYTSGFGAS